MELHNCIISSTIIVNVKYVDEPFTGEMRND